MNNPFKVFIDEETGAQAWIPWTAKDEPAALRKIAKILIDRADALDRAALRESLQTQGLKTDPVRFPGDDG